MSSGLQRRIFLGLVLLAGCAPDAGQIDLSITWSAEAAAPSVDPHYVLQVRGSSASAPGEVIATQGPLRLARDTDLFTLPHGEPFVLVVRAHAVPFSNSPVLGAGQSAPFVLEPGRVTEVRVELAPEGPTSPLPEAPPPPNAERMTLRTAPWGTWASRGRPEYRLVGDPGALEPGRRVVVFDGPDIDVAAELGRAPADDDGGVSVDLGANRGAAIYVAQLDAQDALSDSSTTAGLQASLVGRATWTGGLTGKLPGETFPNPNEVRTLNAAGDALLDRAAREVDEATYARLARPEAAGAEARGLRRWRRHDAPTTPRVGLGDRLVFDPRRGRAVVLDPFDPTTVWEWDGRTWQSVTPSGPTPPPRFIGATVYDAARGVGLLFGGLPSEGAPLGDLWAWDGAQWTELAWVGDGPSARHGAVAVYDSRRARVLLLGGFDGDRALDDAWSWDGVEWRRLPFDPPPRQLASAAYDPARDRVVLTGGANDNGRALVDTWILEGETWRQFGTGSPGRAAGAMVYDAARDRMVLWGGDRSFEAAFDGIAGATTLWEFDPDTGVWAAIGFDGERPPSAFTPSVAYDPHRRETLIFGGGQLDEPFHVDNELWSWDGARFRHLGGGTERIGPGELSNGEAVWFEPDGEPGRAVFYGGCDPEIDGPSCPAGLYAWTGAGWARRVAEGGPTADQDFAMGVDRDAGLVVVHGGITGGVTGDSPPLGDTWLFDGTQWQRHSGGPSPGRVVGHAMAPDPGGGLVLFGGSRISGEISETWRWRDGAWTRTGTVGLRPAPRELHAMAYDPVRQRTVLFGGVRLTGGIRVFSDLWEWDGHRWTERPLPPGTSPRADHSMAFDPLRGAVVIHGGVTTDNQYIVDTATWDGADWARLPTSGDAPPSTRAAGTVYLPGEGVLVVGGLAARGETHGSWVLAGSSWRKADARSTRPSRRLSSGMTYVQAREQVLLHGGCLTFASCPSALRDVWAFDGYRWRPRPTHGAEARGGHALVEGPSGLVLALGGGGPLRVSEPTATLEGSDWTGPRNQRWRHQSSVFWTVAAREPERGHILLFGGRGADDMLRNGLIDWDPITGQQRPTFDGPSARWNHIGAFDEARNVLVVAGGCLDRNCGRRANDVWERNDRTWTQVLQADPSGALNTDGARAVWDPGRGRVVTWASLRLEGSIDDPTPADASTDAWEWDGAEWRAVPTVGPEPAPRSWASLAYHRRFEELVLFGGAASSFEAFDDTWILPTSPRQRPAVQVSFTLPVEVGRGAQVAGLRLRARAAATGYETQVPGVGGPRTGVRVRWWDAWTGAWAGDAVIEGAGALDIDLGLERDAARRHVDHRRQVHLRFEPLEGNGTGSEPATVGLDAVELDADLDFTPSGS